MKHIFLLLCLLTITLASAQKKIKIGKIDASVFNIELSNYQDEGAVFLQKERHTEFKLSDWDQGWYLVNRYRHMVYIKSQEGFDYGTIKVNLYKNAGNKERIDNIEGYTYELTQGEVEKTKLDKGSIFNQALSERWDQASFAMPQVKPGVIIEYTYTVESPFWKIDDLILQEDIPVLAYKAEIKIPEVFQFNTYYQGRHRCDVNSEIKSTSFNFSYSQRDSYGTKTYKTNTANMKLAQAIYTYQKNNIPPLKQEAYTNNLENFRSSVIFELASAEITKGKKKDYTTSWEKVAQTLNNSDRFGKPLLKTNFISEEAIRFRESYPNQKERAHSIYDHIRTNLSWNGEYRSRIDRSLKKVYDSKSGSSGEINLVLVALLREAGLTANPVLSATKSYKVPIYPTLEGFNHILAAVEINNKRILLDATEKYAKPNQLAQNIRNWEGRLIRTDGTSEKIDLFATKHVQEQTMIIANLTDQGSIKGQMRERMIGENEIEFRKKYKTLAPQEQKKEVLRKHNIENISDLELHTSFEKNPEMSFSFESDELAEEIAGKLYVSPLLFLTKTQNPFKNETRETPIDFNYPTIDRKMITINVPENYSLQSQPEPVKLVMNGNLGEYTLNISQQGTAIQIASILQINRTLFPPSDYEIIRSFYSQMIEKQMEKIVLIKNEP